MDKKQLIRNINLFLQQNTVPMDKRREAVSRIVAVAIFSTLPLPSSPISTAVKVAFTDLHSSAVMAELEEINEMYVVDFQKTYEMVYTMWYNAYCTLHEPRHRVRQALASIYDGVEGGSQEDLTPWQAASDFYRSYGVHY